MPAWSYESGNESELGSGGGGGTVAPGLYAMRVAKAAVVKVQGEKCLKVWFDVPLDGGAGIGVSVLFGSRGRDATKYKQLARALDAEGEHDSGEFDVDNFIGDWVYASLAISRTYDGYMHVEYFATADNAARKPIPEDQLQLRTQSRRRLVSDEYVQAPAPRRRPDPTRAALPAPRRSAAKPKEERRRFVLPGEEGRVNRGEASGDKFDDIPF